MMTQVRENSRLLEFATFNDLVLANTFGHHKVFRRWTWHSPNGQHHNQIDYILVIFFHLCLKKNSKPKHTRLKFDLKKLKDLSVLETFQAMIGGKVCTQL